MRAPKKANKVHHKEKKENIFFLVGGECLLLLPPPCERPLLTLNLSKDSWLSIKLKLNVLLLCRFRFEVRSSNQHVKIVLKVLESYFSFYF